MWMKNNAAHNSYLLLFSFPIYYVCVYVCIIQVYGSIAASIIFHAASLNDKLGN